MFGKSILLFDEKTSWITTHRKHDLYLVIFIPI